MACGERDLLIFSLVSDSGGFSCKHPSCKIASRWCVMLFIFFLILFRGNTDKEDNTEDKVDGLQKQMVSQMCCVCNPHYL